MSFDAGLHQADSFQPQHDDTRHAASPKSETTTSHQSGSANSLAHRNKPVKWEGDISVDDHGSVSFHNSTSGLHEPPAHPMAMDQILAPIQQSTPFEEQQAKQELLMNASHQRQMEPFAVANSAVRINVPKEISLELLKYHWCWMHPLFLFVYRPAFTKAMSLVDYSTPDAHDPPYFSDTLLRVIHAHCARMLNHDVYQHHYQTPTDVNSPMATTFSAQEFMQKMTDEARYSLGMDILKQSSIPTIQALLQQSAREVVFGRSSQAWTFAGIAFRMALDMGIHLPTDKLQSSVKTLSAEDIEVRQRLFWSCYTWDKVLSLYLGRMPGKMFFILPASALTVQASHTPPLMICRLHSWTTTLTQTYGRHIMGKRPSPIMPKHQIIHPVLAMSFHASDNFAHSASSSTT